MEHSDMIDRSQRPCLCCSVLTAASICFVVMPARFAGLRTLSRASTNFLSQSTDLSETLFGVMMMRLFGEAL